MDRRFMTVLGVSLVFALLVSSVFYQMTARSSTAKKAEPTDQKDLVVTTRPLGVGVMIKPADVKVDQGWRGRVPQGRIREGRGCSRPPGDLEHSARRADSRRTAGREGQRTRPRADHSRGHARGHGARERRGQRGGICAAGHARGRPGDGPSAGSKAT